MLKRDTDRNHGKELLKGSSAAGASEGDRAVVAADVRGEGSSVLSPNRRVR
jgi:hypothetical protein